MRGRLLSINETRWARVHSGWGLLRCFKILLKLHLNPHYRGFWLGLGTKMASVSEATQSATQSVNRIEIAERFFRRQTEANRWGGFGARRSCAAGLGLVEKWKSWRDEG